MTKTSALKEARREYFETLEASGYRVENTDGGVYSIIGDGFDFEFYPSNNQVCGGQIRYANPTEEQREHWATQLKMENEFEVLWLKIKNKYLDMV